jgi:hypothetical protein
MLTELFETQKSTSVVVARQRNAACLEDLSLAKMQICDKQLFTDWSPDCFLCEKN